MAMIGNPVCPPRGWPAPFLSGLAAEFDVSPPVRVKRRRRAAEPPRPRPAPSLDRLPHEPTPEEIREACRQIRAGWDAQTERQRRVTGNPPAMLHVVAAAEPSD